MADTNFIRQEAEVTLDWHPADVLAALKKRGFSLAGLSAANGYHATAAGKALKQSWPALEVVIAAAVGVPANEIWPSRYSREQSTTQPRRRLIKAK